MRRLAALTGHQPDAADLAARRAHGLAHAVTRVACDRRARDEVELIAKSVAYAIAILSGHDMAL
jgi:predicted Zn-dependent protease